MKLLQESVTGSEMHLLSESVRIAACDGWITEDAYEILRRLLYQTQTGNEQLRKLQGDVCQGCIG